MIRRDHARIGVFAFALAGLALNDHVLKGSGIFPGGVFWNALYHDPDIDDDYLLLQRLTTVIRGGCQAPVVRPAYYIPLACFIF
jgi:hypothetical protein